MSRLLVLLSIVVTIVLGYLYAVNSVSAAPALRVPILSYHYIGNNPEPKDTRRNELSVTPDRFEEQLTYIKQHGFTPITLNQLYGIQNHKETAPAKPIILTFDDGYIDFAVIAMPIIEKYNFKVVSFIPTGKIGGGYYMNWGQISQIEQTGLVEFEAHTVNHLDLTTLSKDKITYEIETSRLQLADHIHKPVNFFAYPYSAYNKAVITAAKKAGFTGALTTIAGKATSCNFVIPRINISGFMTLEQFAKAIES